MLDERLAAVGIRRLTRPQASHLVQKAAAASIQFVAADLVCSLIALRRAVLGPVPDPVEIFGRQCGRDAEPAVIAVRNLAQKSRYPLLFRYF